MKIAYAADSQANHYQIHTISKTTGQGEPPEPCTGTLPQEYEKMYEWDQQGSRANLGDCRKTNRRQNKITDVAQFNEGYKFKMDLTTNGANSAIGRLYFGAIFPLIL